MPRHHQPRNQLPSKRDMTPQLGARRPLEICDNLDIFYTNAETAIRLAVENSANKYSIDRPLKELGVRLYDDIDAKSSQRPALKIFERRFALKHGQKYRISWTRQDIGRIKGNIQEDIDHLEKPNDYLPDGSLKVIFSEIIRLGDGEASKDGKRKFGMIADQATTAAEYLVKEHETVFNGIQTAMSRFVYPYSEYVPQVTLGTFSNDVSNERKNEVIGALQKLLPFSCVLEPIKFYSEQDI